MIESKYDFDLDMDNTNSLSIMINQIKRGSKVLEFGPANGRMTRYLKEMLDCKVYLVEIDEKAGKEALQYGEDLVIDDIETYSWKKKYEDKRFDYITFADVLEHLRDPERVLREAKGLLKQDGSIIFSVPNLAHNAVLINLMNHEFEYNTVGLLDNTHIHFFTKNSIESMMNRTGLSVEKRFATYAPVGTIEIENTYQSVPGIDETYWKSRPFGDIYQFIYVTKRGPEFIKERENYLQSGIHPYFVQVYLDYGMGFDENISRTYAIENPYAAQAIEFDVDEGIRRIRLDPFNAPCMVELDVCTDTIEGERKSLRFMETNADYRHQNKYIFTDSDPRIIFLPAQGRQFHTVRIEFHFVTIDSLKIKSMMEYFQHVCEEGKEKIADLEGKLRAEKQKCLEKENQVFEIQQKLQQELQQKQQEKQRMEQEIAHLQEELNKHSATIQELMGSTSWKMTKPLRAAGDIVHRRK